MAPGPSAATGRAIEAVFRIERAQLIARLARIVGDVDLAEELAQDALVTAMSEWPRTGVPERPGAWLMTAAKRRAIDGLRRREMLARSHAEIAREREAEGHDAIEALDAALDDDLGDEVLGLLFAACHPVLPPEARAALTLRLIAGLGTDAIARAYLVKEATIAQRIVRAKRTLRREDVGFAVPHGAARDERLASVLEVIYLIFNEGYAATAGDNLLRPGLCAEARRLGRILAAAMVDEPEVHGLRALMDLQASRLSARVGTDGQSIALPEQDRTRWDRLLIRTGVQALERARALGGADGPYALQAAIATCHARAPRMADTDWNAIAALYDRLADVLPSPVVLLNRAVAYSMAIGPHAGLAELAPLERTDVLAGYAPLPAARGDFLFRAGRLDEAREAFLEAAALSRNTRERAFLLERGRACHAGRDQG